MTEIPICRPPRRRRRIAAHLAAALLLSLTSGAALGGAAAPAQQQSLLQRLRDLIGYNPRQAVGGSRSGSGPDICLITPRFQPGDASATAPATATVALARPTLLAAGPLNEVRLERDGRILWQQLASSTKPIEGPIAWPLEPLQPGESLLLRLRPRGAAGADFATIQLVAAGAADQQRAASPAGQR